MTPKQKKFVAEYLLDLNATQAAIRTGYSEKTAKEQASRLLTKVNVAAAIKEGMEKRSERTQIDADWLLKRLAEEAQADIADLYHENGNLLPITEWPEIWRKGLVAGVDVAEEKDHNGKKIGEITKIKLSDRLKRLELIGKHIDVSAFTENHRVTVADPGEILAKRRANAK